MENTKKHLSLDFTRPRLIQQPTQSLVTPILALSTPELNKMISGDELAVLTPNGINNVLPSPLIPTTVNSNNIVNNTTCNVIQKRPDKSREMDIEKIEKKRERNRLAAKKCRQRKLETIDELRKTVLSWEQRYERLEMEYERFKAQKNKELEHLRKLLNIKDNDQ